jgi:hypothetical protein
MIYRLGKVIGHRRPDRNQQRASQPGEAKFRFHRHSSNSRLSGRGTTRLFSQRKATIRSLILTASPADFTRANPL